MEGIRDVSEAARFLAARRRRVEAACAFCGRRFEGTTRRRYCSRTCANKAYYQAHKATIRERQREAYRRRKGIQGQQQEGQR
jgi:hypothetical protein